MKKHSRIVRVPKIFLLEIEQIRRNEGINVRTDAMRRATYYTQIGRQLVNKDLLSANVSWFNEAIKKGNKRRKKR